MKILIYQTINNMCIYKINVSYENNDLLIFFFKSLKKFLKIVKYSINSFLEWANLTTKYLNIHFINWKKKLES